MLRHRPPSDCLGRGLVPLHPKRRARESFEVAAGASLVATPIGLGAAISQSVLALSATAVPTLIGGIMQVSGSRLETKQQLEAQLSRIRDSISRIGVSNASTNPLLDRQKAVLDKLANGQYTE